jgi:hypothetical protein
MVIPIQTLKANDSLLDHETNVLLIRMEKYITVHPKGVKGEKKMSEKELSQQIVPWQPSNGRCSVTTCNALFSKLGMFGKGSCEHHCRLCALLSVPWILPL